MSGLRVSLVGDPGAWDVPLAAEIIGEDLNLVETIVLHANGAAADAEVDPGTYLVRARLPYGARIAQTVTVPDQACEPVTLVLPESKHEWLAWPTLLGLVPSAAEAPSQRGLGEFGDIWFRAWSRFPGDPIWHAGGWELTPGPRDDEAMLFETDGDIGSLRVLQLGAEHVPSRFVALPPTPAQIQVVVTPDPSNREFDREFDGGLAVAVMSHNPAAETLLYYLSNGLVDAITGLDSGASDDDMDPFALHVLDDAEALAYGKRGDPAAAAIGLYVLLRTQAAERMHNWPNNYANWLDWIPDGPVIHAWQLLQHGDPATEMETVRQRFLEASFRGVPVYSQGLRLLLEGLEIVAADPASEDDTDVDEALAAARRYAAATDFTQPLTTFIGGHPSEPSVWPRYLTPSEGSDSMVTSPGRAFA